MTPRIRYISSFHLPLLAFAILPAYAAGPSREAQLAFSRYTAEVEARLDRQHGMLERFLAAADDPTASARLRRGELVIEDLVPSGSAETAGAMLHHWRGTAFIPGATAEQFERLLCDFRDYPHRFAPEVVRAEVLSQRADHSRVRLRMRQQHVLTVVLDATYDVTFGQLDTERRFSMSRSVSIVEIASAGAHAGHALSPQDEHGFLWRQNTYWSCEERDRGLLIQIETISLSRGIPRGLGWALRPYVESIPREALAFTLTRVRDALGR